MAQNSHVIVVGAGIGGIMTGISLRNDLGHDNFTIYEAGDDIGGVWRINTYPGCACDVRSHWYSYSRDLNPYWSTQYSPYDEIHRYWLGIVEKYKLRPFIKLKTRLLSAEWDAKTSTYRCLIEHEGKKQEVHAKVVINATGNFGDPSLPDDSIPGVGEFKGPMFHSARWRHDLDLSNKKVGVIGLGASAAQFVPEISKNSTTQIVNFIRTPPWFLERDNSVISETTKWVFANIPGAGRIYRNWLWFRTDSRYFAWKKSWELIRRQFQKQSLQWLHQQAPEEYHEVLTPNYPIGCKRIVIDPGYLRALRRPNLTLNADGIQRVTKNSIITQKGDEYPIDILILGTGFKVAAAYFPVRGTEGTTLQQYYDQHSDGVPEAYRGVVVPTFPNYFTLAGPNTASGHSSVIFSLESYVDHVMKLIKPLVSGQVDSITIRKDATDAFNNAIQKKLRNTAWEGCRSYYRHKGTGRNFTIFPGPLTFQWWQLRNVNWLDYDIVGPGKSSLQKRQGFRSILGLVGFVLSLLIALAVTPYGKRTWAQSILPLANRIASVSWL